MMIVHKDYKGEFSHQGPVLCGWLLRLRLSRLHCVFRSRGPVGFGLFLQGRCSGRSDWGHFHSWQSIIATWTIDHHVIRVRGCSRRAIAAAGLIGHSQRPTCLAPSRSGRFCLQIAAKRSSCQCHAVDMCMAAGSAADPLSRAR